MRTFAPLMLATVAACSFDAGGLPGGGTDAGGDAGPGTDAGSSMPSIACSTAIVDGRLMQVLTLGGDDIESGFLGPRPHATPVRIEYGSDFDSPSNVSNCPDLWAVPYQNGCPRPSAPWGTAPRLNLDLRVDDLNLALVYSDGSVRWGDLKTSDGDGVGFTISGSGAGYDCRIVVTNGGTGGYIRIDS